MIASSSVLPDNTRYTRESVTLDRLYSANDREQKLLDAALRDAACAATKHLDLSPEHHSTLGPKAQALSDVVVALYLRETTTYTKGDLHAHISGKSNPKAATFYLRLMGLAHLDEADLVPRPRVFPRAMLVTDLSKTANLGKATVHRVMQLLSKAGLTVESVGGLNGALDMQVKQPLLALVEEAVMSLPINLPLGHRLDIPRSAAAFISSVVLAAVMSMGVSTNARAEVVDPTMWIMDAGTVSSGAWKELADQAFAEVWDHSSSKAAAAFAWAAPEMLPSDGVAFSGFGDVPRGGKKQLGSSSLYAGAAAYEFWAEPAGKTYPAALGFPSTKAATAFVWDTPGLMPEDSVMLAGLGDVLRDGKKLFGPSPTPAPIDPLQLVTFEVGPSTPVTIANSIKFVFVGG